MTDVTPYPIWMKISLTLIAMVPIVIGIVTILVIFVANTIASVNGNGIEGLDGMVLTISAIMVVLALISITSFIKHYNISRALAVFYSVLVSIYLLNVFVWNDFVISQKIAGTRLFEFNFFKVEYVITYCLSILVLLPSLKIATKEEYFIKTELPFLSGS